MKKHQYREMPYRYEYPPFDSYKRHMAFYFRRKNGVLLFVRQFCLSSGILFDSQWISWNEDYDNMPSWME